MRCPICSLALVLSSHLARSYHHLSPLQDFEHPSSKIPLDQLCFACKQPQPIEEITASGELLAAGTDGDEADAAAAAVVASGGDIRVVTDGSAAALGGGNGVPELVERGDSDSHSHLVAAGDPSAAAERFFQCPHCSRLFCSDCNDFIHFSLHNCPGCL